MERLTLLEMTQRILDSMASDNVNSIDDTDESLIISGIIRDTYYEVITREPWDFLKKVEPLDAYGDTDYPTYLVSPVPVAYLQNVRYNVRKSTDTKDRYQVIQYLTPEEFLDRVLVRPSSETNVETITTPEGIKIYVYNDRAPAYYTSFDDNILVFDNYDSSVDTTLQSSKSIAITVHIPDWTQSDTFTPELPPSMFPMLLAESKVAAHQYLKQQGTPIDAKRSYRQGSMNRWNERKVQDRSPRRGFGRRG